MKFGLDIKYRTRDVLGLAFGTLALLTLIFGVDSIHRARQIYSTIVSIQRSHAATDQLMRDLESGLYQSGIFIRDFLLDNSNITAPMYRQQLVEIRSSMADDVERLSALSQNEDRRLLEQLRREVNRYWDSMEPVLDWTPGQKLALSTTFLRRDVLPRRSAVLEMAEEVKALNEKKLADRQKSIDGSMDDFRRSGLRSLITVFGLGTVISVLSLLRIAGLEKRTAEQHEHTERAERELRLLSSKLVKAQEDERRRLSRELHDEVGQILTALRVGVGNLERLSSGTDEKFRQQMDDAKGLAEQALKSVRNIATGLRPSVLDDFGLGAALQWQAREFSRRTSILTEAAVEELPDELPESHRTSIYRIVQEALTNCARHAQASRITIQVRNRDGVLTLTITDDGKGMPQRLTGARRAGGLGLIGMEERMRELGGTIEIESRPGKGTSLLFTIPVPKGSLIKEAHV